MPDTPILPYERRDAAVEPWDARAPAVAARVTGIVHAVRPDLRVEHVGSSAVPGLDGKNVVDLGIVAPPDDIPGVVASLHRLGFGDQPGPAAWPPTRPMLLGAIDHEGSRFRIHVHVMPPARRELEELIGFRDALRRDPDLRAAYAAAKRGVLERVGGSSKAYAFSKGEWVEQALLDIGVRPPPADHGGVVLPGATIGILGGGQLGRMLGYAARALGYGVVVLDPDPACPAAAVADRVVVGGYDDVEAARVLAAVSDVVTYELEHVDAALADAIGAADVPVRPGPLALRVTQDRLAERRFLRDLGEQTAPGREVRGADLIREAAEALGYPLRLKVPVGGYDGRSQVRIADPAAVDGALVALGREPDDRGPLLLEREIAFDAELSVVAVRDLAGHVRAFPAARNVHDAGVLVESTAPAPVDPVVASDAREIAASIARGLDVVGTLAVELFLLPDGRLAVNELAPRVHNSGHWTVEGCRTSQFEQHVRAICGLPLGSPELHTPVGLVNVLGEGRRRPARLEGVEAALADPAVRLHLYGKREVFERRKMGHLVATGGDPTEAVERARRARTALRWA